MRSSELIMAADRTELVEQAIERARVLFASGDVAGSTQALSQTCQDFPESMPAHNALATLRIATGRFSDAERGLLEIAQRQKPDRDAWALLGSSQLAQAKFREAAATLEQAIEQAVEEAVQQGTDPSGERSPAQGNPGVASLYGNLAAAYLNLRRFGAAEIALRRALDEAPGRADFASNLGMALLQLGRLDEAVEWHDRALALAPERIEYQLNRANTLAAARRYPEALEQLAKAKALAPEDPEIDYLMGLFHLARGNFAEGWPLYEARIAAGHTGLGELPEPERQLTRGALAHLKARRVLVLSEQGAGDIIQFSRFLPALRELGAEVAFVVPNSLQSLLTQLGVSVVSRDASLPDFDHWVLLGSLPGLLDLWPPHEAASAPYLVAPRVVDPHAADPHSATPEENEPLDGARARDCSAPLRVGLVWAGNPDYPDDHQRSIPLGQLDPLGELEGIQWVSLQVGAEAIATGTTDANLAISDWASELRSYSDTARCLEELDLLISVDTSVAHLAGALGVPTWLLLAFSPDWRWRLETPATAWYPKHRLFRQPSPGDWPSVIASVKSELVLAANDLGTQVQQLTR